jgi:glycosyltransferase 2 family protein
MKSPKKHRLRSLVINVALIAIAFGLLGMVINKHRNEILKVLHQNLDGRVFALAFGIYLIGLVVTFVRWYWLVRVIDPAFRLRDAMLLGFIGNVFNLVIPGAIGGDLIKAAYLVRMKVNSTQAIASMVIDRILGLLGLFLLAGIAGLFAWAVAGREVRGLIVIVWVALAVGFLGLAAIFNQALTRRYPALLLGHGRIPTILRELKALSESYRRKLPVVGAGLVISSLCHSFFVMAFYTVSRTISPQGVPTIPQHFLMVPLTLFTTAVPLPFGALGLTEGVSDQLFKLVNHPDGALAMMGFRVLMYGGGLVSACFYLANIRQVRALTDEAEHLEAELIEGDEAEPAGASSLEVGR